ncbi:MAG: L-threonylcarbamoyladenylate synthase [Nitrospirota bacterium]
MIVIRISETDIRQVLQKAVDILNYGSIIAYPTETFYALGIKFDMEDPLKKLYEIKQRPKGKAMPLIVGDKGLLPIVAASVNRTAMFLMDRFWPGPLTLIFHAKESLSEYITAGTHKVAVRIPGESFALYLAKSVNFPITATSANLSGMPPACDAEAVIRYFRDKIDLVINGGPTAGGLPSTIVDVTGDEIKILREGAISRELLTRK